MCNTVVEGIDIVVFGDHQSSGGGVELVHEPSIIDVVVLIVVVAGVVSKGSFSHIAFSGQSQTLATEFQCKPMMQYCFFNSPNIHLTTKYFTFIRHFFFNIHISNRYY